MVSAVGLDRDPKDDVLRWVVLGALIGFGSGIVFGGGIRSSVEEGGEGGVENARPSVPAFSFPINDALLFLGFTMAPIARGTATADVAAAVGLRWGVISEMVRMRLCCGRFCLSLSSVTAGDDISSSSP